MSANDMRHVDYPIGVICALALEKAAFVAMLDEVHEATPTPEDDENSYAFGRIGNHNIVAACLPAGMTGNNSAATVAKDMLRSFTIKIGLLVGIGGGVWSQKTDIRLGDVVISHPEGTHGGVVQWDFGKMESDGFKRTGSLNKPPRPLLNALQDLKMKHMMEGDSLADNLSGMAQKNPKMSSTFLHQGAEHDCLYASTYYHAGAETCDECDMRQIVKRPTRPTTDPQIHYGNIASGNKVVKNGPFRDLIAGKLGVICFEMEAAGLMDSFPCLVVRGICDYADSHKNNQWQPYAAATAAAYAKELIGVLKKQSVDELKPANVCYRTSFSLQGVPKARQFVDRPAEMAQLERVLIPRPKQTQRQKIHILHGLGGMGKTQLAVEFARRHHSRFTTVFWLDGRSEDILKRSIASCASRIPSGQIPDTSRKYAADGGSDIHTVVWDVMGWLGRLDNKDWLLIFDNVDRDHSAEGKDSDAYKVTTYFPGADHGSILVTTRLARLKQLKDSPPLSRLSTAQGGAIFQSWYTKPHDIAERERLLELLGGLPLAIAQAGAFLQETGTCLKAYLDSYKQQWSELMESDDPLLDYPDRSVWTTWEISYQAIRKKHEQTANLLLLWSFLDNKDLWHGLFTGACEREYSVAETLSEWIGKIASSELQFGLAMKLLRNYSLVEEVVESNSHATHPVVHQWARHSQGRDFETKLSRLAVIIVGLNVPDQSVGDYPLQRRLLPHAQVCSRHILETKAFDHLEVAQDTDEGASQFVERRAVLISIDCLGTLYYSQSKLAEANELCKRAFCGMEIVLGPNDELTLMSGNNLGLVYWTQGKFEEAATKFECVLLAMEEVLGCSHLTTVGTVHNLGMVYEKQDKLAKAEQMYERALKVKEVVLGPSHPSTLDTSGTLGGLYMSQGIISKAEPIYKRVLQGQEKTLGPLHPSTLGTINNLGGLYMSQGMLVEAEQKFERALRGYEEVQGKEGAQQYMPALDTLQNMGTIYQKRGEIARAKETWERALSGYINVLGPSNDKCKDLSRGIEMLSARQKDSEETERKEFEKREHEEREHEEREHEEREHEEREHSTKKRKRRNVS